MLSRRLLAALAALSIVLSLPAAALAADPAIKEWEAINTFGYADSTGHVDAFPAAELLNGEILYGGRKGTTDFLFTLDPADGSPGALNATLATTNRIRATATDGSNIYVATATTNTNMAIRRYSSTGSLDWSLPISGSGSIRAIVTDGGNVYVLGTVNGGSTFEGTAIPSGNSGFFVYKASSAGAKVWATPTFTTSASSFSPRGLTVSAGVSFVAGAQAGQPAVRRIDPADGSVTASFNYTGGHTSYNSITPAGDGGVYVAGSSPLLLTRLTAGATEVWSSSLTGSVSGDARVDVGTDGRIYVAGTASGAVDGVSGTYDFYVVAFDNSGDKVGDVLRSGSSEDAEDASGVIGGNNGAWILGNSYASDYNGLGGSGPGYYYPVVTYVTWQLAAPAGLSASDSGNTRVDVQSTISITAPATLDFGAGLPTDTLSLPASVVNVRTNNAGGYIVEADWTAMIGASSAETIAETALNLTLDGNASSGATERTADAGTDHDLAGSITLPFVASDIYNGTATFTATTQ